MPEIALKGVTLAFDGPPLFDGIDFTLEPGERVGLLGRNGAGKSTLMKLIEGKIEPDSGEVVRRRGLSVAVLGQEIPSFAEATIREAFERALASAELPDYEVESRIGRTLARLDLDPTTALEGLSAGGLRRVMLGRALLSEPDLLILDEPTNHLDIDAVRRLEEFLLGFSGALLFVTHDRALLRRVATRILELDRGRLRSYSCSYGVFLERREAELEALAKQDELRDKALAREEVWVRKGLKAQRNRNLSRITALQALREERRKRREQLGRMSIKLEEAERSGQVVFRVEGLTKRYDDETIISDLNTVILRGDRVGIIGPNGSGKTTLLKLLLGELEPDGGTVLRGTKIQVGRMDQIPDLDPARTIIENLDTESDKITALGRTRHVISYLEDFLFTPEQARGLVGKLSGGEKKRLQFARLFARPCNLLILDEPTNDLDLESLEFLEEILSEFGGTVLLVSHDREFLDQVATSTLVFEGDGVVKECAGGYSDWWRVKEAAVKAASQKAKPEATPAKKSTEAAPRAKKLSFKEKHELEGLPARIEKLETERDRFAADMADPGFYKQDKAKIAAAQGRLQALENELSQAYARWEELEARSSP